MLSDMDILQVFQKRLIEKEKTMLSEYSTTSQYRAKAYLGNSILRVRYRYLSDTGDINELDQWLHNQVESGTATGGDVEMWVPGFGWCVYND